MDLIIQYFIISFSMIFVCRLLFFYLDRKKVIRKDIELEPEHILIMKTQKNPERKLIHYYLFRLWRKGFINITGSGIKLFLERIKTSINKEGLSPVELEILDFLEEKRILRDIFFSYRVMLNSKSEVRNMKEELFKMGLVKSEELILFQKVILFSVSFVLVLLGSIYLITNINQGLLAFSLLLLVPFLIFINNHIINTVENYNVVGYSYIKKILGEKVEIPNYDLLFSFSSYRQLQTVPETSGFIYKYEKYHTKISLDEPKKKHDTMFGDCCGDCCSCCGDVGANSCIYCSVDICTEGCCTICGGCCCPL